MRKNFPTLRLNKGYIYLDNAATSLKLYSTIKTVSTFTQKFPLNLHSNSDSDDYFLLKKTVDETRQAIAKWINGKTTEVAFVPSVTYALNFLALAFADLAEPGNEIVITKAEHSSNSYPWMNLSQKKKLQLSYLPLDNQFTIDKERVTEKINNSTIVVSFAHVFNNLGSLNDVKEIVNRIKLANPACYVIVDACQSVTHHLINVKDWGIDALVFSAHKFYGPDGIAVLWVKETLAEKLPQLLWGGGKKSTPLNPLNSIVSYQKFEVGTIPTSYIAGLRAVFHFVTTVNWADLITKQQQLKNYAINSLLRVAGIKIYNSNNGGNILLFNIEGFHSQDVSSYLARNKIFVRAGDFCSPFLRELIDRTSAVRLSLAVYNNRKEIDILVSYLQTLRMNNCLE